MGFIKKIIDKHKATVRFRNKACDDLIVRIDRLCQEIIMTLLNPLLFIEPDERCEWLNQNEFLVGDLKKIQKLKKAVNFKTLLEKKTELYRTFHSLKNEIEKHNSKVIDLRIKKAYSLIGKVEGRYLDKQQMGCIVKEVHNHLVIAGAGTGKTTTIVGKVKFLVKSGKYKPKDILVLSFTNASASELCYRITKETSCNIDVSTFHKLGLNIITSVNGIAPKITQLNLRKFVKEKLMENMQSEAYLNRLSSYLIYNRVISKNEFEFKTQAEYEEYLRINPPTTINNEKVKSYGEMDIANFLAQNGIKYIYEHPYKVDTRTKEYGQYKPDFYLPEYDIYIEYFGINENGEVPSYFKSVNGLTATQSYQASMKWKRETHNANKTVLIECYAYEKNKGVLFKDLKEKLISNGVKLNQIDTKELWNQLSSDNSILDGFIELFETVINLMKSNGYTISDIRKLNIRNSNFQMNNSVLSLVEPIYDSYCDYLKEHMEIDFNDMINLATKFVEQKKYINSYKCIIIDEYQDISKSRFRLLNNLRKSNDFNLFCVGDDWQSIYRFAGSDIGYILNFEQYWGCAEISKIETTYRFTQKLIEISGNFIMKNPTQIKKTSKGKMTRPDSVWVKLVDIQKKRQLDLQLKGLKICQRIAAYSLLGDILLM